MTLMLPGVLQAEFADQTLALSYVANTYIPLRHQWTQCFISEYEKFDVRTNSPTGTAHKDLKSYIITGHADLYTVFGASDEMLANREKGYVEATAIIESRTRREYPRQPWLGDVTKQVGYKALDLMAYQHRIALTAEPSPGGENPPDLQPCRGRFTNQHKLPCSYKILEILKTPGLRLTKYDIHPRWGLEQPLVRLSILLAEHTLIFDLKDALMRIKDPRVVTSLPGRPRKQKIPNPTSTPANSIPSSSLPSSSRLTAPPRKATNPAPRPVRAGIRRNRSAFEYDTEDELAAEPPQETAQDCITVGGDVSTSKRRSGHRAGQPSAFTAPGNLGSGN
ncbi:uncharacterized protein BDZ83DRAFT_757092 [Colletotrichum acutatum]|uniref:Uncharacterized protein n=1 Tax=Glomerella acutata TaxID=27357 RepID=A0AAD8UAW6_GLOAC|nr:uncharacterized protein BDZ83DRAFT_757092 [Colletotrichum acutatum]KAK1712220.1 hypothetical protein BDZ83DRAFT_757092 [Colletotrichum acutatum]